MKRKWKNEKQTPTQFSFQTVTTSSILFLYGIFHMLKIMLNKDLHFQEVSLSLERFTNNNYCSYENVQPQIKLVLIER